MITMTKTTINFIENLNDKDFDTLASLMDKVMYDDDKKAKKTVKTFCKNNNISYDVVDKWFWDEI